MANGSSAGRRYLFVSHDAGGTVPPVLALTQELVADGGMVTVLGQPSVEARTVAAGGGFRAFTELDDYDRTRAIEDQLERSFPAMVGAAVGRDLLAVVEEVRPDLVVVDANLCGAQAAAEALDVPSVVLLHSMYRTFVDVWLGEVWPFLEDPINVTREEFGLDPVRSWTEAFTRHAAALSVVTSELDAPVEPALEGLHHPGFLVPDPGPVDLELPAGDAPLALVSLSTTHQGQDGLLGTVVRAAAPHLRLLVTTAGYGAELPTGPGIVVVDHVPHAAVLAHADLVITHAGLGTVSAALAHGVPLVCTPLGRDQHLNTERVEAVGAGLGVDASASIEDLWATIQRVVDDPTFAAGARRQAERSREAGGAAGAAAFLGSL